MQSTVTIRPPETADLPAMAAILASQDFGDDSLARLKQAFLFLRPLSRVAIENGRLVGVVLASFNGWHVLASQMAVVPHRRGEGIGEALMQAVIDEARNVNAESVIGEARLSAVGFCQKLGFRLPAAMFLIRDV